MMMIMFLLVRLELRARNSLAETLLSSVLNVQGTIYPGSLLLYFSALHLCSTLYLKNNIRRLLTALRRESGGVRREE